MKNLEQNYISILEQSIKNNWEKSALTDYKGISLRYKDLAVQIEKIHILLEEAGIQRGDKIALCNKNCSNWAVAFLNIITYGAVVVPILPDFTEEQMLNILKHSESKLFFTNIHLKSKEKTDFIIIELDTFTPRTKTNKELVEATEKLNLLFGQKYPKDFTPKDVNYYQPDANDLALINYTSGSTGNSKGVMLPYKSLWSNVVFVEEHIGRKCRKDAVLLSILPMAHMYGLAIEFLAQITYGTHIYFLTKIPSPTVIFTAMAEIKPTLIISVPLILEKAVRKMIMPELDNIRIKTLLRLPVISKKIRDSIREKLQNAFGGRFYEVIIGGASLSSDVETLLHQIGFNYTVGYGTTECAPLISYADWKEAKIGSCGKAVDRMEVKIDSPDPHHVVGEILCKGDNLMIGYYKNEEETKRAIDSEGWYHTGDLGIIDNDGFLFIRGRCKNMILGPSGQNIYPEEIEDKLNAMQLVSESVVIQKDSKLYGLVYLDPDEVKLLEQNNGSLSETLELVRKELNADLPAYEQLVGLKVMPTEFEKTPKKSIKRYLYFNEPV